LKDQEELSHSEKKTKDMLYKIIGRKISESRKSARRKLEGISKKLNISIEILKKIENGEIYEYDKNLPINGFIKSFAKITNTDVYDEIHRLQKDYLIEEQPKSVYPNAPEIKTSKVLLVFITSFCFLLLIILFLNFNNNKTKEEGSEISSYNENFFDREILNEVLLEDSKTLFSENREDKITLKEIDESFFDIIFLEETWIEIYNDEKMLMDSGLFKVGESLSFRFESQKSDFFIKSGNLGGFQIFFKDEFFAPFGYSGEVSRGFYLKEEISKIKN